jgi:hypothetical protein
MATAHTIDVRDIDRILISDDPGHVVSSVTDIAMKRFGLSYGAKMKKRWWLGEW